MSLANVPGLGAYIEQTQRNRQQPVAELEQAGSLMKIQQMMQAKDQQEKARAAMTTLGPNATPEEVMAKMRPYVSPEHLFQWTQQAETKKATAEQTRQIAMSRLAQTIQRDASDLSHRARTALTSEERLHWQKQMDTLKAYAAKQSSEIAAGRYTYDTGMSVAPFQGVVPQSPGTAPASAGVGGIPTPSGGGASGVASAAPVVPLPAPTAAPAAAPAAAPMPDAANLDARDLAARAAAPAPSAAPPVAAPVAPAAPAAPVPVMPKFTGSPRAQAAARNGWLAAQAKLDLKISGGRESVYVQRMMMGANQAAKDLANVVQLPLTASTGIFGGRKQGAGLIDATKEVLANKATQQEAQAYNAMATGFQRSLAQIESAGLMPSGSLTHQMDAVLFKEGDTNLTKLHKLAQTRQIVEAGMEVIEANPRVSPEEKAKIKAVLESVRKSVPFTHSDLIRLQVEQGKNPAATLQNSVLGQGSTAAPKDGDTGTSKSGKQTVFRSGRWEYR